MYDKQDELSKYLSQVLRHRPELIGLSLDKYGYAPIDEVVEKASSAGYRFTREELLQMVAGSERKRFVIRDEYIRAVHGHTVPVQLGEPEEPPQFLFYPAAAKEEDQVRTHGAPPTKHTTVKLYNTYGEALAAAGGLLVFRIWAKQMSQNGYRFQPSRPGIWLTEAVPPSYLEVAGTQDIMNVQTVTIRKTARYRKLLKKDFELNSGSITLDMKICFCCHWTCATYTFKKDRIICTSGDSWRILESHRVNGALAGVEQTQDNTFVLLHADLQIDVARGKSKALWTSIQPSQNAYVSFCCPECQRENVFGLYDKPGTKTCQCGVPLLAFEGVALAQVSGF